MSRELLPIAIGLGVGTVLAGLRPTLTVGAALVPALPLGFLVTVITGEFELGWEYVLMDIPLVALSAMAGFWLVRAARRSAWPSGP